MQRTFSAEHVDLGWRYLQIDDLRGADREFSAALKSSAMMYPAHAGHGYVALARRDFDRALTAFDVALGADRFYVPALVGRGQALLALRREGEALAAFDAALAADPSLTDVRQRAEVLRFRGLQDVIEAARSAAKSGRAPEARAAYERAIAASPDSAFLYRELGVLERRAGNSGQALSRLRRATELDPLDEIALVQLAELLEAGQDFVGAEVAYRKAVALNPSPELEARTRHGRQERARGAAAAGVQGRPHLRAADAWRARRAHRGSARAPRARGSEASGRGHRHARTLGGNVDRGGGQRRHHRALREPHLPTRRGHPPRRPGDGDQPPAGGDRVWRSGLRARLAERPVIADMNQRHNQYAAAAAAVSSGVMPLLEGGRFQVERVVSGSEAVEVLDRVRTLSVRVINAGL